jgi:hypothetical protein
VQPIHESIRQSRSVYWLWWHVFYLRNTKVAMRSQRFWAETRNKFKGRRGWVIGNGPSLRVSDLNRLREEICIASNKIYLAYQNTEWRPTYFTCVDKLVWLKIKPHLSKINPPPIVSSTLTIGAVKTPIIVARLLGGHKSADRAFSTDCSRGVFGGRTVTFFNLQIAAHLGLNPIYLLGCDHRYNGEDEASSQGQLVRHTGLSNHFIANYRKPGELVNSAPIHEMNSAFAVARCVAEESGIHIINATRGGHLESFERALFDKVVAR